MVKVVGTSFNIRSVNGNTEVIVETGIVEVSQKNRKVVLHPKEKVLIGNRDTALVKNQETDALYNYYRTNEFVCDNTPLWKLVEVLNEAYHVQIVIGRNELRNLPLTTTFSNESLDRILEVISITFNTKINRAGDRIIIQ
jgi:ferric-dicitrate binding protein FerR (iron transport regulator)